MSIRVVLADDHDVMRNSISDILRYAPDIEVVGEARNGREALHLAEKLTPDVLLLDMEMPGLKGVEVAQRLQQMASPVRILALSAHDEKEYVLSLLAGGAAGYLLKGESPQTIIEAIRGVARGEQGWVNRQLSQQIPVWTDKIKRKKSAKLTDQEMAVLRLLASGKTDQQIETMLGLSRAKVKTCLTRILTKLNATTRVEAAMRAVQEDLI